MLKTKPVLSKAIRLSEGLMVTASVITVLTMFMQVVLRYVFKTGFHWSEELARFVNVFMVFIGATVLVYEDSHISVTIFDELLKGNALKVLKLVQYTITAIYCAVLTRIGFATLPIVRTQTSANLGIRMNMIYVIMPVSFLLMLIYLLPKIVHLLGPNDINTDTRGGGA